ncbi:helix-turn-helix domain-containing protein [Variovorax sp. 350MFTsu5.1]|jgi:DNA-binding transcriptional regulator YiaG|uniref:helix-turn-helix domain-containing protein n=1 Tax=Variovorax sp. 350MFTsu5.1 TaxID=3158365 RepID=UPI003AB06FFE
MPNITSALKEEIARVARKEVRVEIETLKKQSVQHRSAIAALRREIAALQKAVRQLSKLDSRKMSTAEATPSDEGGPRRRFSASRVAAHRAKLGLSAADYGTLVGVSGQTIYHWEQGKARPRAAQLENLAAVRSLGRPEIAERLGH